MALIASQSPMNGGERTCMYIQISEQVPSRSTVANRAVHSPTRRKDQVWTGGTFCRTEDSITRDASKRLVVSLRQGISNQEVEVSGSGRFLRRVLHGRLPATSRSNCHYLS
jgi:hypothetical protein